MIIGHLKKIKDFLEQQEPEQNIHDV